MTKEDCIEVIIFELGLWKHRTWKAWEEEKANQVVHTWRGAAAVLFHDKILYLFGKYRKYPKQEEQEDRKYWTFSFEGRTWNLGQIGKESKDPWRVCQQ